MHYETIDPVTIDLLAKETSVCSSNPKDPDSSISRLKETIEASGLTSSQWVALLLIADANVKHPFQLSSLMQISRAKVTNIVDQLQELNLVTRTREMSDRRRVTLHLTESGRSLIPHST